jgi:hypothetical protein
METWEAIADYNRRFARPPADPTLPAGGRRADHGAFRIKPGVSGMS